MLHNHLGKKAQIGETMTWVVATIVIIVILGISIFVASAKFNTDKTPNLQSVSHADTLASKSLFSYVLTKNSTGQTIYDQLNHSNNLNYFNGNLAETIFDGFYGKDYPYLIWLGFLSENNNYFGPTPAKAGASSRGHFDPFANNNLGAYEVVNFYKGLGEIKSIHLLLFKQ